MMTPKAVLQVSFVSSDKPKQNKPNTTKQTNNQPNKNKQKNHSANHRVCSLAGWEVVRILKELGIRPRRTVRAVCWTNEENGSRGGKLYKKVHVDGLAEDSKPTETNTSSSSSSSSSASASSSSSSSTTSSSSVSSSNASDSSASSSGKAKEVHVAAIETDMGVAEAIGFGFTGSSAAEQMLQQLMNTYLKVNTSSFCFACKRILTFSLPSL